ncbi:MAG TPA: hypothetical protein VM638_02990 [Actinomycetota bacterium]|nr:hypothetical protein [Actinomycetota bacterium]
MAVAADRLRPPSHRARRRVPTGRRAAGRRAAARTRARVATRARRIPFGVTALCLVALVILGLVAAQALVTQDSFRLAELARRAEALEADYGRLRLEAARLSSPDRIASAARRAGMVLPEQVELIRLPAVAPAGSSEETTELGTFALKGVLGGGP